MLDMAGVLPDRGKLRTGWLRAIRAVFDEACLILPEKSYSQTCGRIGAHHEDLGHLLTEMQPVARSHPGAVW